MVARRESPVLQTQPQSVDNIASSHTSFLEPLILRYETPTKYSSSPLGSPKCYTTPVDPTFSPFVSKSKIASPEVKPKEPSFNVTSVTNIESRTICKDDSNIAGVSGEPANPLDAGLSDEEHSAPIEDDVEGDPSSSTSMQFLASSDFAPAIQPPTNKELLVTESTLCLTEISAKETEELGKEHKTVHKVS